MQNQRKATISETVFGVLPIFHRSNLAENGLALPHANDLSSEFHFVDCDGGFVGTSVEVQRNQEDQDSPQVSIMSGGHFLISHTLRARLNDDINDERIGAVGNRPEDVFPHSLEQRIAVSTSYGHYL